MQRHESSLKDASVRSVKIAYIGGGSRGWAWGLMSDLALEGCLSGEVRLYDIDMEAAKANEKIGNSLNGRDDVKGEWQYKVYETLDEAVKGVDFVVISILPGTFDEMESDVHTPEKYGIYQSVGDTVGPAGLVRALRTLPMYEVIAKAVEKNCPNAWVISYTNPMSLCMKSLYNTFPKIKAFGCCHEVFGTQGLIAKIVQQALGVEGVTREDLVCNVIGINHFTWLDKVEYKGIDVLPIYRKFIEDHPEGYVHSQEGHWMNSIFYAKERIKFDLFMRYGAIAAAGDRHLAEFCPGDWYIKNPEVVKAWDFALTPVQWRKDDLKNRLAKSERMLKGEEKFVLWRTGEDGVRQMKALLGLDTIVTNVNIPNIGQAPDLPLGSIVETNAQFSNNRIVPLVAGKLSNELYPLVSRHVYNQNTIASAVKERDLELAYKAFVNDPLVTITLRDSRKLFIEMLQNTKQYLESYDLKDWC